MASANERDETSSSSDDDDVEESSCVITCLKLELPENLAAYLDKKELDRDVEPIDCRKEVIDNVCNNYVIIKRIINYLPWQEKVICKNVCSLWHSVVHTLSKEQLAPIDFSINLTISARRKGYQLKKSGEFYTEPLVVFIFANTPAINEFTSGKCELLVHNPCSTPCEKEHSLLDMIYQQTSAPKDCMFVTKSLNIAYLPLPNSLTHSNAITRLLRASEPYYSGLYIPAIPGVEFKVFNMKTLKDLGDLVKQLKEMTERYVIKGALAYLTDNYTLYVDQQESIIVNCLYHLGTLQPDQPFALGGCLVEDTLNTKVDMENLIDSINNETEFISGNQLSLGLFVIPKNEEVKCNFEVYSSVIESTEWSKEKIQLSIRQFSQRIPRFEHSVAFKLSCSGRHQKHEMEQNYFRTLFPNTRIIGCFGNGELGVNFPPKASPEPQKRVKTELQYERVHSYSTVFVYVGWGKMLAPAECDAEH